MNCGRSQNPRPRQTRRKREEDAPGVQTPDVDSTQDTRQSAEDNAGQVPSQQASSAQSSNPTSDSAMLRQMFEFLATSQQQQQQQQQQFTQLMQQQALFQQQMLQQQATTQRQQKRKGNPPMFNGETSDDLELWLFSTEQYYADSQTDMASDTSDFVNLIFGNLGPTAQTWFRDFKVSLGDRPATWTLFKQQIRERFRDSDFQYKLLSKLYNLRWTGSQQS
ncbi:hypothetical protein DVH05_016537 [Phytophthora capsici]|nr:hypothetical protein DVH05_016537 [Phytophthora capsici]